jgi:uncharacterized protein (DUF1499 family)
MAYPAAFAAVQHACCADLHPATLKMPPAEAYRRALTLATQQPGWQTTRGDADGLVIEVVATTALFRFHDDVVIRVRPDASGGSRVDMRSKSRDGQGDVGTNTLRIHQFVDALEQQDRSAPAR